jgi:hypothetical protein
MHGLYHGRGPGGKGMSDERIAEWQSVDLRVGHGRCGDLARALRGEKR